MRFDQLRALAAAVDHGSFEAAARALHITPSAMSQRIKALESEAGQVLVRRSLPVQVTEAGAPVLRMAREVALLEAETRAAIGEASGADTPGEPTPLHVAVNADSLATWFAPVLGAVAGWADTTLHLEVEDQGYSAELLRRGDAVGAVVGTSAASPPVVAGCRVEPLGVMRYLPVATPEVRARHTQGRSVDWGRMPVVQFGAKDDLQWGLLRDKGVDVAPPTSVVPSSEGFLAAVRAGLGWGMLPEAQLADELETGELVLLDGRAHADVRLFWQVWRLRSERVERLTGAVHDAARSLRPMR
ncbi:LysR family transcriptional regulator ArgP [Actinomycetota bacterium]